MKVRLLPEAQLSSSEKLVLRKKLDAFYHNVPDYTAFKTPSDQIHCWEHVVIELQERLKSHGTRTPPIRVLEIGAGKSGFGAWLVQRGLRAQVHWTAQDVTSLNADWLMTRADEFVLGDVSAIKAVACFDVILSTYVLEHTTDPSDHLNSLNALLRPSGSLFVFCPRYDVPGYSCPSSRHLGLISRLGLMLQMLRFRLRSRLSRDPAFLIQTDLAAFHVPFFTDADAVHWVSLFDLSLWAKRSGLFLRKIEIGNPRMGSKDWIVKRLLTCAVHMRKSAFPA